MTGRNEPCPCGSGKKYKKCCAIKPTEKRPNRRPISAEIMARLERHRRAEEERRTRFGDTRPVISTMFNEHRVVAVGNSIHWAKSWKTFPDFLFSYIKTVMGSDWGKAELAKQTEEAHPIIQWFRAWGQLQLEEKARSSPNDEGVYSTVIDGPTRAYLLLAYDLYVLRHHGALQEEVVRRLKHRNQFQGARYELFVAATMIRSGCDIEYEDERDVSRKHPEFVATHRTTAQKVAVEAKSRHRPGVLGRPGSPTPSNEFTLGVTRLIRAAIEKRPAHPYIIFLDTNAPPENMSPLSPVNWQQEVQRSVEAVDTGVSESGLYVGSAFNMLVLTNMADHYGARGQAVPNSVFYRLMPSLAVHQLSDGRLLGAVENALEQYGSVPQDSPDE